MWRWRRERERGEAFRRRISGRRAALQVEWLEPRQVMAVSILSPLPDIVLASNSPNQSIPLAGLYDDTAVGGTVIRFDVNGSAPLDKVYVELFDASAPGRARVTPITAANFLQYVDAGHYANTMIHRSVPGFVVQGGGFNLPATGPLQIGSVTNLGQILNEPGPVGSTNVRGTIAMAKLGGNPNSASNQWFFNLADNTDPLNSNSLDNQNGGFTTFGRVLGNGMNTVDAIAGLTPYDLGQGGNFTATPLRNIPNPVPNGFTLSQSNFVLFPSISRVNELVYSVTTDNPSLVTPSISDGRANLSFAAGGTGTATVNVRVASVFDSNDFVVDSFVVTRQSVAQPDAIAGTSGGSLWVAESGGSSFTTRRVAGLPADTNFAEQLQGDFNGDRRADTAARASDGTWWVALTPAAGTVATATSWGQWSAPIQWTNVSAIDVNADGRSDIVGRDPSSGSWWASISDGSTFTTVFFGSWSSSIAWANVTVGDFDGDGRGDVAGRDPAGGGWWVSRGTAAGFSTTSFGTWSTADWQTVVTGDFNGDGRTDIAGRQRAGGTWWVATSDGTRFTNTKFGGWSTAVNWTSILVGDFDGDGRSDIAGRDADKGNWWISRSTGTAFSTARAGGWTTSIAWQSVVVGDFTGDGRADIAGRDPVTGAWWVARSGGAGGATTFTNSRFGAWSKSAVWTNIAAVLT